MSTPLHDIFQRLLAETTTDFHRALFYQINTRNRLTGLVGPRGVGKTTLLLQYIKKNYPDDKQVFYFSADHLYFKEITLYHFIEQLFLTEAIHTFFIDEIHKYDNWNQELKNLYDAFPAIKIVFSGSSSIDLIKGQYDLSRRAVMYYLHGLSFREYLEYFHEIKFSSYPLEIITSQADTVMHDIAKTPGLLGHFYHYLKQGFYPFAKEDPLSYNEKLRTVIEKTIYEDVANFYNLPTGHLKYFTKILNYLASRSPGKINSHNIAKNIGINDKTVNHYLSILCETGLVTILHPAETGNAGLRRPEKVFLSNTNLYYAINEYLPGAADIDAVRELFFVQSAKGGEYEIFCDKQGDYQINNHVYEIGGKNKTRKQIHGLKNASLVKDEIIHASFQTIPLLYFGFLY